MNQSVIKAIVLSSILILCLPMVSAAGDSAGSSGASTSQDVPDFSSCESTNASSLNPYCPLWDGEHAKPDPFLVYDFRKRIEVSEYGIASLQPPPGWRGLPTKGTVRIPVFLVDFPDAPHDESQTVADVQAKMFGDGNSGDYPYESLKNYYQRSSYNQLTITGEVYGWHRAAQNRSYYMSLGKPGRIALINEILQAYDSQVNYADYDADHNGKMDAIFIKWAGSDTGWATFWWASMSTVSSSVTFDGVSPYNFVWSWYSRPDGGAYHPQIDIHETGHLLGLPDYYDYDVSTGPKGGVGGWDMMDANWGDHNAFSKYLLGWIDPLVVNSGTREILLPPSGTTPSGNAVLIMPGAVPDSFGEFFLVQYREPGTGNDPLTTGLKKAVWIWHVDSTLTAGGGDYLYDNSATPHKLLRLMEADGREQIETENCYGDVNDFYIPGQALGPGTVPDTRAYSGSLTNVTVTTIEQHASSMQMDFSIPSAAPVADFTGTPLSGTSPLGMTFADTSTGSMITNRRWDFGDGNISNYAESTNPFHRYTRAGTYTVNLTITGTAGTDSKVKSDYITVVNAVNLTTKIGIYRHGAFYLRNSNTGGNADIVFGYGNLAGDIPVVGDGDGNGTDTMGVYRNGVFYLRNSNTGGNADVVFGYGNPAGDIPVVGDWDGNGTDTIGVFRNGAFYLRNSNTNGIADLAFTYGQLGDVPIVGDWDGNSIDTIGVYRNGVVYLRNSNTNGIADMTITYGQPGDVPVVGDWDGNGIDTIGVYRNGVFYLRNSNTNGIADLAFTYGQPGDVPIVGDWDGT